MAASDAGLSRGHGCVCRTLFHYRRVDFGKLLAEMNMSHIAIRSQYSAAVLFLDGHGPWQWMPGFVSRLICRGLHSLKRERILGGEGIQLALNSRVSTRAVWLFQRVAARDTVSRGSCGAFAELSSVCRGVGFEKMTVRRRLAARPHLTAQALKCQASIWRSLGGTPVPSTQCRVASPAIDARRSRSYARNRRASCAFSRTTRW